MAKKKATSSDVAARAGVSQATVSMVLNRKYNVSFSRETVERVEQAARELGWTAENGIREMCEDSWRWQSQNPNGYEA